MNMRLKKLGSVAAVAAVALTGCSTVMKAMKLSQNRELNEIAAAIPKSRALEDRIQLYEKYASKFLKFHDSGSLDEGDVLDVLRDTGVIKGGAGGTYGGTTAQKHPGAVKVPPPVAAYHGKYRWPTDAGVVSSEYGARWGKMHKGVDVAGDMGEPVIASADGVVIYAGSTMRGYGNALIVRHDDSVTTLYAHNSKLLVHQGDTVKGGQMISLLGSTGHSTGPHVHFEIRRGENPVNPRTMLGPAPYASAEGPEEDSRMASAAR